MITEQTEPVAPRPRFFFWEGGNCSKSGSARQMGAVEGQQFSLEACASMYVVLRGLSESMPHLPWMETAGTKIGHPGYEE